MRNVTNPCRISFGRGEQKKLLGIPRRRCKDKVKIDTKEIA
jgi:hypothetical protein